MPETEKIEPKLVRAVKGMSNGVCVCLCGCVCGCYGVREREIERDRHKQMVTEQTLARQEKAT